MGKKRKREIYLKTKEGVFKICGNFEVEEVEFWEIENRNRNLTETARDLVGIGILVFFLLFWILVLINLASN